MGKLYSLEEIEKIINDFLIHSLDEDYEKITEIISMFNESLAEYEDYNKALFLLGMAYYSTWQFECIDIFKKAAVLEKDNDKYWYFLSKSYFEKGKYDKSKKILKKTLKLNANDSAYWFLLGRIYFISKDYEKSLRFYKRAMMLNNTNIVDRENSIYHYIRYIAENYFQLKKYNKVIKYYEKIEKEYNFNEYDYMYLALSYKKIKNYDKAIENFKKALDINNRSYLYNEESPCINNLAKTYIKIGKYREAIELYKDFIKKESNGNGLILIPYSLNGIDDYKYLISAFDELIEEEPHNLNYYNDLFSIYKFNLNLYDKAIEVYEKYISNNTDIDSCIYEKLSSLYSQVFKYDKAIETYNKLIETNGENESYCISLGELYNTIGDYERAVYFYEKVINLENIYQNTFEEICILLLDLYSKLSRFDDRNALISKAYNYYLNEEDYNNIANLYIHIGEKDKAIEIYKKIIELDTYSNIDCTDYYIKIADIYKEINQECTANEYYQKAIDIYEEKLKTDDSGYYLGLLCNLYMIIGNKDKSVLYYKEYIEMLIKESKAEMENEGTDHISWSKALEIASSYRKIGDFENAIKYYEYALYDNADLEYCYDSIAEIYDEINEKEKAKEYYQKSIDIHKKYFETHSYHCDSLKDMAKLYLKIDDKEKAKECYQKVLYINIYDNEVKEYLEKLNI